MKEQNTEIKYLIGTMIEVPRAALLADQIAQVADFFSFGTNDLTQMTFGMSRDDAGRFLPDYVDEKKTGILANDPFQSLDQRRRPLMQIAPLKAGQSRTSRSASAASTAETVFSRVLPPEQLRLCPARPSGCR
jgi:pyruvate,orthophosphate dikinase